MTIKTTSYGLRWAPDNDRKARFKSCFRSGWIGFAALLSLSIVYAVAPQQLPIVLLKLSEVSLGAYVGYWIDRNIFYYARPHQFLNTLRYDVFPLAMLRRAIIVAATMVAFALAL